MSHYNKWAGGGYYYSDWWKKKDKKKDKEKGEKEEGSKSSSPSTSPSSSLPSTTTTPYRSSGYGGYGSYSSYYDDDDYYDEGDVVNYKDIYRSRYKSSLGYSSEKLSSSTIWWSGYGGTYSYGSYGGAYSCAGKASGDEFEQLKTFLIKAVKEARDLIVILDFPYKIKICFDSNTPILKKNQKRIFVTTSMLSDSSKTDEEKLGIFCGLAVHEASHLKYTTLSVINKYIKDILDI